MAQPPNDAARHSLAVAVAGEDPLARSALASRLAAGGEPLTVQEVELGALDAPGPDRPDVVLLDLGLSGREGFEALRELAARGVPTLALVAHEEAALEAVAAGAASVLFRDARPSTLAAALRAVDEGLSTFDRALAPALLRPAEPPLPDGPREELTPREQEVLALLAQGLSNKDLAARLSISEHTAKFHVNAILAKLGVQRRIEAVVRAARLGMVTL